MFASLAAAPCATNASEPASLRSTTLGALSYYPVASGMRLSDPLCLGGLQWRGHPLPVPREFPESSVAHRRHCMQLAISLQRIPALAERCIGETGARPEPTFFPRPGGRRAADWSALPPLLLHAHGIYEGCLRLVRCSVSLPRSSSRRRSPPARVSLADRLLAKFAAADIAPFGRHTSLQGRRQAAANAQEALLTLDSIGARSRGGRSPGSSAQGRCPSHRLPPAGSPWPLP